MGCLLFLICFVLLIDLPPFGIFAFWAWHMWGGWGVFWTVVAAAVLAFWAMASEPRISEADM